MTDTRDWKQEVADWKASGLKAKTFSKERGYPTTRLWAWSSRLKKSQTMAVVSGKKPRMMKVIRAKPVESCAPIVVELHGTRILVMPGTDGATLSMVLQAMSAHQKTGGTR